MSSTLSIDTKGAWRLYWGGTPLPKGATAHGTVRRYADGFTGAIVLLASGIYVQGCGGSFRTLCQRDVTKALDMAATSEEATG